jgi:hypothetical protein
MSSVSRLGKFIQGILRNLFPQNLVRFYLFFFPTMFLLIFLDDLIFVVPSFARKCNTVGGLREENIEAFHNIGKYLHMK